MVPVICTTVNHTVQDRSCRSLLQGLYTIWKIILILSVFAIDMTLMPRKFFDIHLVKPVIYQAYSKIVKQKYRMDGQSNIKIVRDI